jgi:drug/metabolite transporter (DMT)-like permease
VSIAYVFAVLASVFYGASDFCGGIAARRGEVWAVTFVAGFGALATLALGAPLLSGVTRSGDLAWAAAAAVCGALGAMLIYRAFAIGPVNVASPVLCVMSLALPVVVGLALGDRPSRYGSIGLVIAPLSIVLLAQGGEGNDPAGRAHARRVLGPALLAGLVAGAFLVCFGQVQRGAGVVPFILARLVGMAVLAAGLLARRKPLSPGRAAVPLALAAGAFDSIANVTYVLATQRGQLSLVAALVSLSPATVVLLAWLALRERWNGRQWIGFVAALVAGGLISFG